MPKVTVYIREEDYEAWKELGNRSEWLHQQLSTPTDSLPDRELERKIKQIVAEEFDRREREYGQ